MSVFQCHLSSRSKSTVLFMDNLYPTVFNRILITNLSAIISTSIVNKDYFYLSKSLGNERIQTFSNVFFNIINGYRYCYFSFLLLCIHNSML